MKNEMEEKRNYQKLNALRDMVKVVNSDVLMLKKISVQTESIMQNENLCRNEINAFENNLGCLIKEHSKQVDELIKEKTVTDEGEPEKPLFTEDECRVILSKEIFN